MTIRSPRVAHLLETRARIAVTADGQVSSGYDGIESAASVDAYDLDPEEAWTAEERAELADVMIARWTAYRGPR